MAGQSGYVFNVGPCWDKQEKWVPPPVQDLMKVMVEAPGQFDWKEGDIMVNSFPRSGTHMVWRIVRTILSTSYDQPSDPFEGSFIGYPTFNPTNQSSDSRVYAGHVIPRDLGDDVMLKGNRKFIYIMRNPKDTFNSGYLIHSGTNLTVPLYSEVLKDFHTTEGMGRPWYKHVRAWEEYTQKHPDAPVLNMCFEDIIRKPEQTFVRLAEFLGVSLSGDNLKYVIEKCGMQQMKRHAETVEDSTGGAIPKLNIYRKGKIGDWENRFTVADSEAFDAEVAKCLEGSKLKFIYT